MNNMNSSKQYPISLCMIVKNEESNLEECLLSFRPIADEIVIVDTGSEDRTRAIAERFTRKVISSPWREDFSYSRNISIDHADGPWCLWADADDRLPESEIQKINELKTRTPDRALSFRITIPLLGALSSCFTQIRMFPSDKKLCFEKPIHEEITTSLKRNHYEISHEDIEIHHIGYADERLKKEKALRNLKLLYDHLDDYEDDPVYLSQIADAHAVLDQPETALEYYEKAFFHPACQRDATQLYGLLPVRISAIYKEQGDIPQSLAWLDTALRLNPHSIHAIFLKGEICEEMGDDLNAAGCFEKVLSLAERSDQFLSLDRMLKAKAYVLLGRIERKRSHIDNAKQCFLTATSLFPTVIDSYYELGETYLQEGKFQDAVHYFGKSLSMNPTFSPVPLIGMAKICNYLGKSEQKEIFLRKLLAHFPEDAQGKQVIQQIM